MPSLQLVLVSSKNVLSIIEITFKPRQGGVNSINIKKIIKIGWKAVSDFWVIRKKMGNI